MARTRISRLTLWMNGLPVGDWSRTAQGSELRYAEAWAADTQSRPVSLSLPIAPGNTPWRGDRVTAFFDNLLPDNDAIRERLARRHQPGRVGTACPRVSSMYAHVAWARRARPANGH